MSTRLSNPRVEPLEKEDWDEEVNLNEQDLNLPEKWILSRLSKTIDDYNNQLERFYFNEAAKVLYDFTWNDFCDWYIEIAKTQFYGDDESKADIARTISRKCIRGGLAMLHPYSAFITEELWSKFKKSEASDLIITPWPEKETNQIKM